MDAEMKEMFGIIIDKIGDMDQKIDTMQNDITDLKQRTLKLEMNQESKIIPRIDALYEGLQGVHEKEYQTGQKVERLEKDAGELKIRVDALESKVG